MKTSIKFNQKLYSEKAVKSAIKAYGALVNFRFKKEKNYFVAEVNDIDSSDLEIIKGEFCNYVLSVMQNEK